VQPGPHPLEENLSGSVPGPAGGQVLLVGLLSLELQDGLSDVLRAEPALARNVLKDCLAGGGLGQRSNGVGKVSSESRLSPTVLWL